MEKSIPFQRKAFRNERLFFTQNEMSIKFMKKILKRLCTGALPFATVFTDLSAIPVFVEQQVILYWTKSEERVGIVEKVMNDGSIGSTFNEGYISRG